jgi:dipeptidyl aminopeptidase/acylaminoacyl peptidase
MRIGYAIDVMNLIESLHLIIDLDPERVGVVGHSMGGGIATYVMVLSERVDAVSLYASMSADQAINWQHIHDTWSPGGMDFLAQTYGTPDENPEGYASISPIHHLGRVRVPVNIHHGALDDQVPLAWSTDLAALLREAGVETKFYIYPEAGHTFRNPDLTTFLLRDLAFFDHHVKGQP